ncbi:MAG: ErfK/YbiS/YcfS/YnhG family protein [Myxococcales bacterium]|nr:ErfK/YbiS/YcfS/YnhG family protein [Myxococcales bacterium]
MRALALVTLIGGCGGKKDPPPTRDQVPAPVADDSDDPPAPPAAAVFPEGTRSLELVRTVGVRLEPGDDAKRIGTVAIDTRVRWTSTAVAKGCTKPWVEIVPRGWVCADYLTPSKKPPMGREVPMLERGELVPGVYGKVTAPNSVTYALEKPAIKKPDKKADKKNNPKQPSGPVTSTTEVDTPKKLPESKMIEDKPLVGSVNVRQWEEVTVGGKQYWRVAQKDNEYVLRSAISPHRPSLYNGTRLGDDTGWTVPIAFVWPRAGYQSTYTMNKANGGGIHRQVTARTPVAILETVSDPGGKPLAHRIGAAEWIRATDVRVFSTAPPPALLQKHERWIDIDLESQILVAFEGEIPVYATMVSSGGKETPTETGVYRMWLKESEADMKGLNGEDPYSVATVPWTQFFSPEKGLAIHTAYWHDQFGTKRSHGCVNLAPKDARWLYFWSDPQVPPGWTMAAGVVEAPGSIVRVRTKDEPDPPARGYAKKVVEVRQQNAPR